MLRVVPHYIPDDRTNTVTNRGKRGRKSGAKVKRINFSDFRGAEIRSKREKGHFEYVCKEWCFEDTTSEKLRGIQFPGAFSNKSIG